VDLYFVDGPRGVLAYKLVNNTHEPKTFWVKERFVGEFDRVYEVPEVTEIKQLAPGQSRPAWIEDRVDMKNDFPIVYEQSGDGWVKADYKYRSD
jgi:hypothetical protein